MRLFIAIRDLFSGIEWSQNLAFLAGMIVFCLPYLVIFALFGSK